MKKQKVFALALAILLAAGSAGCSGKSNQAATASSGSNSYSSGSTTLKNFGDVQLTMLNCWNGSTDSDISDTEVGKAIKAKIGVSVKIQGCSMKEVEKMNLLLASGDMPDFIDASYWSSPDAETLLIKKGINEGMFLSIDDYFNEFPDLKRAYQVGVISQSYKDTDVEDPAFGGKHYVLPAETPGDTADITRWTYGLAVRGDIPAKIGIDASTVHTPDDLYNFLKKIKESNLKDINGNDVIPLSTMHSGWSIDQAVVGFDDGPYLTDFRKGSDGKTTYKAFTQSYLNKVLYIRKLVSEGLVDKECFTCTDEQVSSKNASGTIAVCAAMYGSCLDNQKATTILDDHSEMKYKPLGPLYYSTGETNTQLELNGRTGAHVYLFSKTNKNLEATLAWIAFMNSKEGQILTRYGIEGKTFEYNSKGQPRMLQSLVTKEKNPKTSSEVTSLLKSLGVNQYSLRYADKSVTWFGESGPFAEDTTDSDVTAFNEKNYRPLKVVDGYSVGTLITSFSRYDEFSDLMAGDRETTALDKAYFASSDAEATKIINEYINYLKTGENAVLPALLNYIDQNLSKRTDWVY